MAGGDKTNEHGTIADRVARTRERAPLHGSTVGLRRPPAPPLDHERPAIAMPDPTPTDTRPTEGVHVYVTTPTGEVPGLLAEWRRTTGNGWEAYVARLEHHAGRWVSVRSWVPAHQVRPR